MSMDIGKQLQQLARREQMRIWLMRLNARLPPLLWLSSFALVAGACIHQLLRPLDPLAVTCFAIAPSLFVLLWTAFTERPTADEGAAAADRLFGANSLFVSAWELTRLAAAIEGIGPLLMARTETALPAWRRRIRVPQKHDMNPASLIAVTLGLAGLFFLLLPSHTRTTDVSYAAPSMPMQPGHRAESPDRILSELFTPPEITAAKAPEQNLEREASLAPSNPDTSQSQMRDDQETADSARELSDQTAGLTISRDDTDAAAAQTVLPSSAETEGRKVPDRTPGDHAASDTGKTITRRERFEQSRLIDIETGVDDRVTAFDGAREGAALLASGPQAGVIRQPAGPPSREAVQTGSATLLSAQQRTRVWRYFTQLEKTDEPNE